jgi:hypothetical protein
VGYAWWCPKTPCGVSSDRCCLQARHCACMKQAGSRRVVTLWPAEESAPPNPLLRGLSGRWCSQAEEGRLTLFCAALPPSLAPPRCALNPVGAHPLSRSHTPAFPPPWGRNPALGRGFGHKQSVASPLPLLSRGAKGPLWSRNVKAVASSLRSALTFLSRRSGNGAKKGGYAFTGDRE